MGNPDGREPRAEIAKARHEQSEPMCGRRKVWGPLKGPGNSEAFGVLTCILLLFGAHKSIIARIPNIKLLNIYSSQKEINVLKYIS